MLILRKKNFFFFCSHYKCVIQDEDNISKKQTKLETEKRIDIGNILFNAMRKRRFLMRFGQLIVYFIFLKFNDRMNKNDLMST